MKTSELSSLCRGIGTPSGFILDEAGEKSIKTMVSDKSCTFLTHRGRLVLYTKPDIRQCPEDEAAAIFTSLNDLYSTFHHVGEKRRQVEYTANMNHRSPAAGRHFQNYMSYLQHNLWSTSKPRSSIYELLPEGSYEMGYSLNDFLFGKAMDDEDWLKICHRSAEIPLDDIKNPTENERLADYPRIDQMDEDILLRKSISFMKPYKKSFASGSISDADSAYYSMQPDSGWDSNTRATSRLSNRTLDIHDEMLQENVASTPDTLKEERCRSFESQTKRSLMSDTINAVFDEEMGRVHSDNSFSRMEVKIKENPIDLPKEKYTSFEKRTEEWLNSGASRGSSLNTKVVADSDSLKKTMFQTNEDYSKQTNEHIVQRSIRPGSSIHKEVSPPKAIYPIPRPPTQRKESPAVHLRKPLRTKIVSSKMKRNVDVDKKETPSATITVGSNSTRLKMARAKSELKAQEAIENEKFTKPDEVKDSSTSPKTEGKMKSSTVSPSTTSEDLLSQAQNAAVDGKNLTLEAGKTILAAKSQIIRPGNSVFLPAQINSIEKFSDIDHDSEEESPYSRLRELQTQLSPTEATAAHCILQNSRTKSSSQQKLLKKRPKSKLGQTLPPRPIKPKDEDEFDLDLLIRRKQQSKESMSVSPQTTAKRPSNLLDHVLGKIESSVDPINADSVRFSSYLDTEVAKRALELAAERDRLDEKRKKSQEKAKLDEEKENISLNELQTKLVDLSEGHITRQKDLQIQKQELEQELALVKEEEKVAREFEEQAKKNIIISRKASREEREKKRLLEFEEKKNSLEKMKKKEMQRFQSSIEEEEAFLAFHPLAEERLKNLKERKEKHLADLEAKFAALLESEEIRLDERREAEEDAIRDVEQAVEEEAIDRLREDRIAVEDSSNEILQKLRRLRLLEEEERQCHLAELRRIEQEKIKKIEEEKRRKEEEDRALAEWNRQEEEFYRRAQEELEARQRQLEQRKKHNLDLRTSATHSKHKLRLTKPWTFSYMVVWRNHYIERCSPVSQSKSKGRSNRSVSRPKTAV